MSTTFFIIAGAVALGSVILSALLLWSSCKIVSVPGARLHQAIIIVLISTILSVAVGALLVFALPTHELRPLEVLLAYLFLLLLISVFIPIVCIRVQWKTSLLRSLAIWLLWSTFSSVLGVVVGVPLGLVGRQFFEVFIVPTGAMAETIQGYHKDVTCPQCGFEFAVNASQEADPGPDGRRLLVSGCTCPNCRLSIEFGREGAATPALSTGDRVLVNKKLDGSPERFDVIVFRYPGPPFGTSQGPINYIKRLVGLPGETIGIRQGDLYVLPGAQPSAEDLKTPEAERHDKPFMHEDEQLALLEDGDPRFEIVRKPPDKVLALRRLVHDNDHPARDGGGPCWVPEREGEGWWRRVEPNGFHRDLAKSDPWLRYHHVLRKPDGRPQLITDFMAYNTYQPRRDGMGPSEGGWSGDLILECEVTVHDNGPNGHVTLELSRGSERFWAHWNCENGECMLLRLKEPHTGDGSPPGDSFRQLETKTTALKGAGTHTLRFANVDARLIVWVDDVLVFGDGISYMPFKERGPYPNDLQPASIRVNGGEVTVRHIKLHRDVYFTTEPGMADAAPEDSDWSDPKKWGPLRQARGKTWYVQPGHYFTLGDNSLQSSDSRMWGLVPERHLLGKAIFIYYPLARSGPIR